MSQFDVYALADGALVIDCQTDHFSDIRTRLVVPLVHVREAPQQQPRLNPILRVNGEDLLLLTQFATAIPAAELRRPLGSLAGDRLKIIAAFDMLLTGL